MPEFGYSGFADIYSGNDDYNQIAFIVKQMLARVSTAALVQVTAVTNAGDLAPVGFLDALPMVHQIDGAGNVTPHGTLSRLPYIRMQGGTDAIIMDPKVGDIGVAVFAHRDISSVKATRKLSAPGSFRRNDWQDGIYVGMCLNGTPTQYIRFSTLGINITSPTAVTINAPNIALDSNGNLWTTGEITRGHGGGDQVTLGQHRHGLGTAVAGTSVPSPNT
jgi:hypothetical protein